MSRKIEAFIVEARRDAKRRFAMIDFRRTEMVARHKDERTNLGRRQEKRWVAEANERSQRLPRGFSGIWHRLTGQYAKIKAQSEQETLQAWQRDRVEKDVLIFRRFEERQVLQRDVKKQRAIVREELMQLRKEVANYKESEGFDRELEKAEEERRRRHSRLRRSLDP